jgi:hypothetical protein
MKNNDIRFVKYFFMLALLVSVLFGVLTHFYGNIDEGAVKYENRNFQSICPPFQAHFISMEIKRETEYMANDGMNREKITDTETHYIVTNSYDCDCLSENFIEKFIYHYLDTIKGNKTRHYNPYIAGIMPIKELVILSSSKGLMFTETLPLSADDIDWLEVQKNTIVEVKLSLDKKTNKEKIIEFSPFRCP